MGESLGDQIARVRFDPVRLRDGYDMTEVDWFLDQLESKVRAGEPIEQFVTGTRFRTVRLREGYDIGEVDRFLATVLERSRSAVAEPPAAHVEATAPSSAIRELRSPWERLFGRRRG